MEDQDNRCKIRIFGPVIEQMYISLFWVILGAPIAAIFIFGLLFFIKFLLTDFGGISIIVGGILYIIISLIRDRMRG
jgi:predicted membrane channel-forming protein YqfA (hemolysin III family)